MLVLIAFQQSSIPKPVAKKSKINLLNILLIIPKSFYKLMSKKKQKYELSKYNLTLFRQKNKNSDKQHSH
jgi:hypothetical protein